MAAHGNPFDFNGLSLFEVWNDHIFHLTTSLYCREARIDDFAARNRKALSNNCKIDSRPQKFAVATHSSQEMPSDHVLSGLKLRTTSAAMLDICVVVPDFQGVRHFPHHATSKESRGTMADFTCTSF